MSRPSEWHLHLGPLDVGVRVRAIHSGEVSQEQDRALPGAAAVRALPRADPSPVRRIRAAEDNVLDREAEGGGLG